MKNQIGKGVDEVKDKNDKILSLLYTIIEQLSADKNNDVWPKKLTLNEPPPIPEGPDVKIVAEGEKEPKDCCCNKKHKVSKQPVKIEHLNPDYYNYPHVMIYGVPEAIPKDYDYITSDKYQTIEGIKNILKPGIEYTAKLEVLMELYNYIEALIADLKNEKNKTDYKK